MKFWLKTLCTTLIVISQAHANNVSTFVNSLDQADLERWQLFNHHPSVKSLDELTRTAEINSKTKHLNSIFQDPTKIAPNRRLASDEEKEILVKIKMRTAIIHQRDEKYLLTRFDFKNPDAALLANYFIFYEIEHLARDLLDQSTVGFTDINALRGYENLYKLSGISKETYHQWFQEILEENRLGLGKRMQERAKKIDLTVQNLQLNPVPNKLSFGDVPMMNNSDGRPVRKFVAVSTYERPELDLGIPVRLLDRDGRERYIVFQDPTFTKGDSSDRDSPYSIRAHFAFSGNVYNHEEWVKARISRSRNINKDGSMFNIGAEHRFHIHIHDKYISPNNGHLSGLPARPLEDGEIFSFESRIDGDNGKRIDTFHVLASEYIQTFYLLAEQSQTFGNFLDKLILLQKSATVGEFLVTANLREPLVKNHSLWHSFNKPYQQYNNMNELWNIIYKKKIDQKLLRPHIAKLITYIEGR